MQKETSAQGPKNKFCRFFVFFGYNNGDDSSQKECQCI